MEKKIKVKVDQHKKNKFIPHAEFKKFKENYKKDPVLVLEDDSALNGFSFLGPDFMQLHGTPGLNGIFISFITTDDGALSLALQPLDDKGRIMKRQKLATNPLMRGGDDEEVLENALPCPSHCPETPQ